MRRQTLLIAASVWTLALSGCLSGAEELEAHDTSPSDPDKGLDYARSVLDASPTPGIDKVAAIDRMAHFVETYAPRVTGTTGELEAAQFLAEELAQLPGWEVEIRQIPIAGTDGEPEVARVIEATRWGSTQPDHIIGWGGHYDTSVLLGPGDVDPVPFGYGLTVEGAYDNGAGTRISVEIAKLFTDVPTDKTLKVLLFNGEEEGLVASRAYVNTAMPDNATFDTFIGFDMVGISWPAPYCQCIFTNVQGWDDLKLLAEGVVFDYLEYQRGNDTVQVFDFNSRNSDESAFHGVGIPTLRWAGMFRAADYPAYHKADDTMATIYDTAGGRENYEEGMARVMTAVYYTVLALDEATVEIAEDS